jgi:transposase-like protein
MTNETGVNVQLVQRRRTRSEIAQIVAQFANSGLNRTEFCRGHGMTLGTLNRYLQRSREGAAGHSGDGAFIAVELAGPKLAMDSGLTVVLSRGRRIAVAAGFDASTLQRLLLVLEDA